VINSVSRRLVFAILAASTLAVAVPGPAAMGEPRARAAHTVTGTETGDLHFIRSSGSQLFEEGPASGPLPGHIRGDFDIESTFSGTVTIYARGGTVRGHGTATPRGSGRYQSFAGTLTITGGTGRYAHARGRGGFYGTFDRKTYAVVVQTTGRYYY
jgi:hypothetical protein